MGENSVSQKHLKLIKRFTNYCYTELSNCGLQCPHADIQSELQWTYIRAKKTYEARSENHSASLDTYLAAAFRTQLLRMKKALTQDKVLKKHLRNQVGVLDTVEEPQMDELFEERDIISMFSDSRDRVIVKELINPSEEVVECSAALASRHNGRYGSGDSTESSFLAIQKVYKMTRKQFQVSLERIRKIVKKNIVKQRKTFDTKLTFC